MPILTADQIIAAPDIVLQEVHIPEWGGEVMVRQMTAGQRDIWETSIRKDQNDIRAKFAVAVCCDDKGEPLFQPEHVPALSKKCSPALDRIWDAGMELNKMRTEDVEKAEGES